MGDKVKDSGKTTLEDMKENKTEEPNTTANKKASDPRDHRDFRVSSRSICPKSSWCPDYSLIVSLPVYKINCHPMLTWHVLGAGKVLQVASFELVIWDSTGIQFLQFTKTQAGDKK